METAFIELLRQVAGGVIIYEPFRRTKDGMREFQDIVHRLQEMERLGLVGRLFTQTRQDAQGDDYIDLVMVQGGLTQEGQTLLLGQEG